MSYYRLRALRALEQARSMPCHAGRLRLLQLAGLYEKNVALEERLRAQPRLLFPVLIAAP